MHCATSRLAGAQVVQMKAMTIRVALAFTVAQGQHAASTRCTPEAFNDSATSCLSEQRTPDQRVHGLVSDPLASWRGQLSALRKQYATEGFVVVSGLVSQQRQADAVSAAVNSTSNHVYLAAPHATGRLTDLMSRILAVVGDGDRGFDTGP